MVYFLRDGKTEQQRMEAVLFFSKVNLSKDIIEQDSGLACLSASVSLVLEGSFVEEVVDDSDNSDNDDESPKIVEKPQENDEGATERLEVAATLTTAIPKAVAPPKKCGRKPKEPIAPAGAADVTTNAESSLGYIRTSTYPNRDRTSAKNTQDKQKVVAPELKPTAKKAKRRTPKVQTPTEPAAKPAPPISSVTSRKEFQDLTRRFCFCVSFRRMSTNCLLTQGAETATTSEFKKLEDLMAAMQKSHAQDIQKIQQAQSKKEEEKPLDLSDSEESEPRRGDPQGRTKRKVCACVSALASHLNVFQEKNHHKEDSRRGHGSCDGVLRGRGDRDHKHSRADPRKGRDSDVSDREERRRKSRGYQEKSRGDREQRSESRERSRDRFPGRQSRKDGRHREEDQEKSRGDREQRFGSRDRSRDRFPRERHHSYEDGRHHERNQSYKDGNRNRREDDGRYFEDNQRNFRPMLQSYQMPTYLMPQQIQQQQQPQQIQQQQQPQQIFVLQQASQQQFQPFQTGGRGMVFM